FSPLRGFMTSKDYLRVVREMRLENGLPWSMPITLAVSQDVAKTIAVGKEIALRARSGKLVAILDVTDKFTPDKALECEEVYRTTDEKHPGVAYVRSTGEVYIGGELHVIERPADAL